jgi:hypothetical protein
MNTIFKMIRYQYYFNYTRRIKGWHNKYIAKIASAVLVTGFLAINLATLPIIIDGIFNTSIIDHVIADLGLYAIILLFFLVYLLLYVFVFSKHEVIIEEFENIPAKRKQRNDLIIYAYMILSFLLYMGSGIYIIDKDQNVETIKERKDINA